MKMQTGRLQAISLIIFFSVLTVSLLQAQTYSYRHYTVENGLSSSTVYWALQDNEGFIWFGTDAGVTRFDGTTFRQYSTEDGLSDDEVLKIYQDKKGRIWFLTFNGKLSYYLDGEFHNTKNDTVLKKTISDSHYHSFLEDSKGDLWFGTVRGNVMTLHGDTVRHIKPVGGIEQRNKWSSIYETGKNEIDVINAHAWQRNVRDSTNGVNFEVRPYSVILLFNVKAGEAFALNENGIIKMNDDKIEWVIKNKNLSFRFVNQISCDGKSIWLSTSGKGCYFYKDYSTGGEPEVLLKNKVICSTMKDREGNIWLCTAGEGVYMLPSNYASTRNYQLQDGLTSDNLYSVTRDAKGGIWLGLSNGTLNRIFDNKITSYDSRYPVTPYQRVLKIISDRDNNIWCVTDFAASMFRYDLNGTYQKISLPMPNAYKSISEDKDGNILITYFFGVYQLKREKIIKNDYFIEPLKGTDSVRTYHSFTDHRGIIWSSTSRGLSSFDGKKLVYHTGTDLDDKRITNIREFEDSLLVFATDGYGVLFFRNGEVVLTVTKKDGLNSNVCHSLFTRKSKIWVTTSNGISKIDLSSNHPFITTYTTVNGLLSNEVRDVYDDDSLLYAATSKGLSIIDYNFNADSAAPPNVHFTSILIDNKPQRIENSFTVNYTSKNIAINFAAITYEYPERLIYQYRLNHSEKWTESKNHQVEFFSLDPGKYEFEVRAKKINSAWSPAAMISFEIIPPFWKKWPFRVLSFLLLAIAIYLLIRQYLRRKIQTELVAVQQQNEIEKERSRIASDMHDDLGSDVTRISMLSRLIQNESTPQEHVRDHSKKIIQTSNEILQKMDEIIWALNSSNRRIENLFSYIHGFAFDYFERSNVSYHVSIAENLPEIAMSAIQRRNIFLVVKESLNNIIKHAAATSVEIRLEADGNGIIITISDNGSGFQHQELPPGRNGIRNMKKRLSEIKGTLEISSTPGKGTEIVIRVPVTQIK